MNTKRAVKVFFGATLALTGAQLEADTRVVDKLHGPYFTIQEAVDAAAVGDTVFIKNGIHDVGGKLDGFTPSMSNRVYVTKSLTLVGESKEGTIVKGAHATEGVDSVGLGCGANAVRCLGINADNVVVSNLTLTGGATHNNEASGKGDLPENNGGGVYAVNGKKGIVVVDCIISNNVARRAGALRYGNDSADKHGDCLLVRTWVHDNKALDRDPAVRGCLAAFCLFTRHYRRGSITYAATFVNCTFADGYGRNHSETADVVGYNCLFADEWYQDNGQAKWFNCAFNKQNAITTSTTNEACVFNPGYDLFMAPPLTDYRLHDGATAVIGKGEATFLDQIPEAYRSLDFYGHAVDATSVSLGCAQEVVKPTGGTITFAGQPGMSDAKQPIGSYGVETDYGLYSFNGRPFGNAKDLGYIRTMEGRTVVTVTHDPTGATSANALKGLHSFTASGADTTRRYANADGAFVFVAPSAGKTLTLKPNFNAAVVYVDRSSSAVAPDGSEAAPYASLSAALSGLASGAYATVHVKAGVYDDGTMKQTRRFGNSSGKATYSTHAARAVVPANVSVIGAGADKTFIVGADDPDAATENKGCGPAAVRCVALAKGARLSGFTLTGGRTDVGTDTANDDDDFHGGGVLAEYGANADELAVVTDCIISNCVARRGGGGYNGVYSRVRFLGNSVIQGGNGSAARGKDGGNCFLVNGLIDRNEGYATAYTATLVSCTFGADNTQGGNKNGAQVIADASAVANCLILGEKKAQALTAFHGCAFSPKTEQRIKENSSAGYDSACRVSDDLSVDANLAPVIGANAAVDAAAADGYDAAKWGEKDVYGNPRVMNGGKMDIGAVEADWCPVYTKKLGKRFVVTAADPAVELVDGGVKIPAGASLAATVGRVDRANGAYVLKATVEDGATCAVTQDGDAAEPLTAGANEVRYATGETGLSGFVFSADAFGSTVLSSLKADTGVLLILR